jgi:hypothetical protein
VQAITKILFRGQHVVLSTYIKKKEKLNVNELNIWFKKLKKA